LNEASIQAGGCKGIHKPEVQWPLITKVNLISGINFTKPEHKFGENYSVPPIKYY